VDLHLAGSKITGVVVVMLSPAIVVPARTVQSRCKPHVRNWLTQAGKNLTADPFWTLVQRIGYKRKKAEPSQKMIYQALVVAPNPGGVKK
jgi:hypothetical protein